jgi:DNA-binding HxlR family transcriptional regulator
MKLKKITEGKITKSPALEKRWYEDACGSALGLELLGERWSLLIVRELMFGGRRFSDLRGSLSGISANILTMRLEGLERFGIIQRRTLPPPSAAQIYELTAWGYEAEVILRELGRWATRSPLHDPMLPLSVASLLMSFRTMYSPIRAKGEAAAIGFRFGADAFVLDFDGKGVHPRRAEPQGCALTVAADPTTLASVVYGGRPLADAEASGELKLTGDRKLFGRFLTWFPLPDKIG